MDAPSDSVAARLSLNPGLQRVPHPKIELFQLKDFVPDHLRAELIRLISQHPNITIKALAAESVAQTV